MQFTKIIKYTTFLSLILLFSFSMFAQEDDDNELNTDTVSVESVQKEKKFQLFKFLQKKDKENEDFDEYEEDEIEESTDSIEDTQKEKKDFFSFLRRKKDSNDSISKTEPDSIAPKEKFSLFKKEKNDSNATAGSKPDKIRPGKWINMNAQEQDSLLRAWDEYDKEHYNKKYAFTRKEVDIALKRDRNFLEKQLYKRARTKPFRHQKKVITRQNRRYKKTLKYDRLKKSDTAPTDTMSNRNQYQIVNKKYKREAKKEAIRKNKVVIKYNRKEDRLRRKYELSDNEVLLLNKGKGMRLKGSELVGFNRARKKQENFTGKLLELRKKRSFALQSENVQERMKENEKKLKRRDKERYSSLYKKKKKKKSNKHDSSEYPKRYEK